MRREGRGRSLLFVLHGEDVGGASLSVLRLVPKLEELGWRCSFWAPRPSPLFDEVSSRALEVSGAPLPSLGYSLEALRLEPGVLPRLARAPRYYAELARTIRRARPDVCHCNSMYTLDEAALARALGVPTVMHVHEMVGDSPKHRLARRLMHTVGDVVVGVSEASVASLSFGRQEAMLVHEAADVPRSVPDRSGRGRTIVGSIGVIAPRKGTDTFVESSRLVGTVAPDVEFRLVGAPADPLHADWAADVLAAASAAGVDHEACADVPATLAGWDIFVLPSRVDPFPIVVLEAMASGLPVIGSMVDGLNEQVTSQTGLLVKADDPESLAEAILRLHREVELRESLGAAGRERVRQLFSPTRQAQGLHAAYLEALEGA